MSREEIRLAAFRPEDQAAVRALILNGLEEHWGEIDPELNPDLDDFATSYAAGTTVLAWNDSTIVGTGTLMPRSDEVSEVVRMSVARDHRRSGIATAVLHELIAIARSSGGRRIVLETTHAWDDAVAFYSSFGFVVSHLEEGDFGTDIHFTFDLDEIAQARSVQDGRRSR